MSLSLGSCTAVCVCVCVVGRADKQAMGWEVEGLHRLRLLTQVWQNVTQRAPRNLAGGAQRCNLIPSTEKHTETGCQGHSSIYSYNSPCAFFFLLCINQLYAISLVRFSLLSVSLSLAVWHSITHSASVSGQRIKRR